VRSSSGPAPHHHRACECFSRVSSTDPSFSGIAFYTGDAFPAWRGDLLLAGLASEALTRLALDGTRVRAEERIPMGERIRDVASGPDGFVYLLTDDARGRVLRLKPVDRRE
jgi:aldose sugar dehydrogenase